MGLNHGWTEIIRFEDEKEWCAVFYWEEGFKGERLGLDIVN